MLLHGSPAGNWELLPVLRRLTAVAVILLNLLGAASPAFACSLAAPMSDCCGQAGTSSPCAGGEGFVQGSDDTTARCCASGYAAFPGAAIDSGRTSSEHSHPPSSSDALPVIAWSASWSSPVLAHLTLASLIRPPPSAALTYLHTARLRL